MADKLMEWIGGIWDTVTDIGSDDKAVNVVPRDLDGGVIGGSDAPGYTVIVDENGPLLTEDNPGNVVLRGHDGSILAPIESGVVTVIDNASFTETVTGADIDFSKYRHAILSIKTGTATTSPTLTAKIQIKDSNGNYIDHTVLTAISTATTVIEELFYLSAETIRVVCTFGGEGNFATTTVELTMKS